MSTNTPHQHIIKERFYKIDNKNRLPQKLNNWLKNSSLFTFKYPTKCQSNIHMTYDTFEHFSLHLVAHLTCIQVTTCVWIFIFFDLDMVNPSHSSQISPAISGYVTEETNPIDIHAYMPFFLEFKISNKNSLKKEKKSNRN